MTAIDIAGSRFSDRIRHVRKIQSLVRYVRVGCGVAIYGATPSRDAESVGRSRNDADSGTFSVGFIPSLHVFPHNST